jgi:hypothetical protein
MKTTRITAVAVLIVGSGMSSKKGSRSSCQPSDRPDELTLAVAAASLSLVVVRSPSLMGDASLTA